MMRFYLKGGKEVKVFDHPWEMKNTQYPPVLRHDMTDAIIKVVRPENVSYVLRIQVFCFAVAY